MRIGPQHGITRRGLLGAALSGAFVAGAAPEKSKVVIARDPALRAAGGSADSSRVLKMLDRAMQSFYGGDSPTDAWKKVVRPGEVIGLKVNCLSGRGAATNPVLVEAICERLQQAGIPQKDIVIWDRLNSDLESAGYRVASRKDRVRCIGNDTGGYDSELAVYGSAGNLLSNTLTRTCDAVINLPVLKDHGIVGVTLALKNLFGAIHNPNKYHLNAGDPYVADGAPANTASAVIHALSLRTDTPYAVIESDGDCMTGGQSRQLETVAVQCRHRRDVVDETLSH